MRYQFLKENKEKYNIQKACKILRISRSGYYDYLKRRESKRAIENGALTEMIEDIFHEHKGHYGSRRIQKVLEQQGVHVNAKRVCRLMSEHSLVAKGTRKFYRYQANKTAYDEKENILNQVFKASEKNRIWVGDITYIPTKHGWLYLAVFIDIYSRKVLGWAMDTRYMGYCQSLCDLFCTTRSPIWMKKTGLRYFRKLLYVDNIGISAIINIEGSTTKWLAQ